MITILLKGVCYNSTGLTLKWTCENKNITTTNRMKGFHQIFINHPSVNNPVILGSLYWRLQSSQFSRFHFFFSVLNFPSFLHFLSFWVTTIFLFEDGLGFSLIHSFASKTRRRGIWLHWEFSGNENSIMKITPHLIRLSRNVTKAYSKVYCINFAVLCTIKIRLTCALNFRIKEYLPLSVQWFFEFSHGRSSCFESLIAFARKFCIAMYIRSLINLK